MRMRMGAQALVIAACKALLCKGALRATPHPHRLASFSFCIELDLQGANMACPSHAFAPRPPTPPHTHLALACRRRRWSCTLRWDVAYIRILSHLPPGTHLGTAPVVPAVQWSVPAACCCPCTAWRTLPPHGLTSRDAPLQVRKRMGDAVADELLSGHQALKNKLQELNSTTREKDALAYDTAMDEAFNVSEPCLTLPQAAAPCSASTEDTSSSC